jgi:hypothetical protein
LPLTSAVVRRQVVACPLGYLVQGGHEGSAPLGQFVGDGHRRAVADRAGDQAAGGQVAEPLRQDGVTDPADPSGQVAEADGPVREVAEDDRGPPLAQEPERAGQMLGRWLALVRADVYDPQNVFNQNFPLPT